MAEKQKIDGNDPAYPTGEVLDGGGQVKDYKVSGLSVRAELARAAMQGLLSGKYWTSDGETTFIQSGIGWNFDKTPSGVAKMSVQMADVLIAELNK